MAENKEERTEGRDPPAAEPGPSVVTDDNCVFCRIVKKELPSNIVYEDKDFVVFTDRKPVSDHHYLVVPRRHIQDARVLTSEHIPLIEKMADIGKTVLREKAGSEDDSRMGFHWPPFLFVKHLHLHMIAPVANMSWFQRTVVFRVDSLVFSSPNYMTNYLKSKN